jgi:ankyrin repeat protein
MAVAGGEAYLQLKNLYIMSEKYLTKLSNKDDITPVYAGLLLKQSLQSLMDWGAFFTQPDRYLDDWNAKIRVAIELLDNLSSISKGKHRTDSFYLIETRQTHEWTEHGWSIKNEQMAGKAVRIGELVRKLHETLPLPETSPALNDAAQPKNVDLLEVVDRLLLKGTDTRLSPQVTDSATNIAAERSPIFGAAQDSETSEAGQSDSKRMREISSWILGNHRDNDIYHAAVRERVPSTCGWILKNLSFKNWHDSANSDHGKVLWVSSPAGFGKTITCAYVIEYLLSETSSPLAYFFLPKGFESNKDPYAAVRSWIYQIMSRPEVFAIVDLAWKSQYGPAATRSDIIKIFHNIVHSIPNCTFILDGADEFEWNDVGKVDDFFKTLFTETVATNTRFLFFSRNDIESQYLSLIDGAYIIGVSQDDVRLDIVACAKNMIRGIFHKMSDAGIDSMAAMIADRCCGQFLCLEALKQSLRSVKSETQAKKIIAAAVPGNVSKMYDRDWTRISRLPQIERVFAVSILRWVTFAFRPLNVVELSISVMHDLALDGDHDPTRDQLLDMVDGTYIAYFLGEIQRLCGCLLKIRVDPGMKTTIHLSHFSVKEHYILNIGTPNSVLRSCETLQSLDDIHSRFATICLKYIDSPERMDQEPAKNLNGFENLFYDYAADSWYRHLSLTKTQHSPLVRAFFDPTNDNLQLWGEWYKSNSMNLQSDARGNPLSGSYYDIKEHPLYYAAHIGLKHTVKFMVQRLPSANYSLPLAMRAACAQGHLEIAEQLLDGGASSTAVDGNGRTLMHLAALFGRANIVEMLLAEGTNLTLVDKMGATPLHYASYYGHVTVVEVLLSAGADIDAMDGDDWTPLHTASGNGHRDVVACLVGAGVDISCSGPAGQTALHLAAAKGNLAVAELLVKAGADLAARTEQRLTPLHEASISGYPELVRFLLAEGAVASLADADGQTALYSAMPRHMAVIDAFLENGVDLASASENGISPLHMATIAGNTDIIKFLLEKGADINLPSELTGSSALLMASSRGKLDIVRFLLSREADTGSKNLDNRTALYLAANEGHYEVVQALLRKGPMQLYTEDRYGATPLFAAFRNGHYDVAQLLVVQDDTCIDSKDSFGRSLMWWARRAGNTHLVHLLCKSSNIDWLQLDSSEVPEDGESMPYGADLKRCFVCTRCIPDFASYYLCKFCSNGFSICMECFKFRVQCRDKSHEWTFRECKPNV